MILFILELLGNPWYIADAVYNKNKDMQKISPEIKDIFSFVKLVTINVPISDNTAPTPCVILFITSSPLE